jgi:gamma-D-glutamyl-L-lysine dipeptidyl-peptidase
MRKIKCAIALLLVGMSMSVQAQTVRYGVVTKSVINLQTKPAYAAEIATQALLGMPVHILESDKDRDWFKIQTPEGYEGWTTDESVKELDAAAMKAWNKTPKLMITDYFVILRKEASESASVVADAVWGDLVKNIGEETGYYKVELPTGRVAFVKKEAAQPFDQWLASRRPTADNIIATGKHLLGFPYFWGGTSIKGVDCSGFTKTSYYLNGVILLRDASQQATTGDSIDISKGYDNLKPGDLLFFGSKRVTHVGMYIGNGEFIHSSGTVHIGSLLPSAPNYDKWNTARLRKACRIITRIDKDAHIVSIKNHPFYQ